MEPIGFWAVLDRLGWEPAAIGLLLLLLAAFILAVLRGRLVPKATVDEVRQDRKDRLEELAKERDLWKQAHDTVVGTIQIRDAQFEKLLSQGALTNELLTSLRTEAER